MTLLLQTLILGLLVGGVYALMSSGFTLVFGVMRVINLAHAAMIVAAAFLTWWVWDRTGLDPLLVGVRGQRRSCTASAGCSTRPSSPGSSGSTRS